MCHVRAFLWGTRSRYVSANPIAPIWTHRNETWAFRPRSPFVPRRLPCASWQSEEHAVCSFRLSALEPAWSPCAFFFPASLFQRASSRSASRDTTRSHHALMCSTAFARAWRSSCSCPEHGLPASQPSLHSSIRHCFSAHKVSKIQPERCTCVVWRVLSRFATTGLV